MTILLKAVVNEGIAVITDIDLPVELAAGAWIIGSITIRNDGVDDNIASVLITEWDGAAYGVYISLASGASCVFDIPSGLISMPNQNATITIHGCHEEAGGEFVIDGREFKVDDTKSH